MGEIELEKTFLLKNKPEGLEKCDWVEILDIYLPEAVEHPILRIRKRKSKEKSIFEITKKEPIKGNDSSEQYEKTIPLSKKEYEDLAKLGGKRFRKKRYYYPQENKGIKMEVDIYLDDLEGLEVVDFEFKTVEEKNNFQMPDFCLADVTQEKVFAGGILAGKKYSDIEPALEKYGCFLRKNRLKLG